MNGTADMLGALLFVLELERPDMADRFPLLPTGFVIVVVVLVTGIDRPPGLLIPPLPLPAAEATLPFPVISALLSLDVVFMGAGICVIYFCITTRPVLICTASATFLDLSRPINHSCGVWSST